MKIIDRIKGLLKRTPANAGKEVAMSDKETPTPAGASAGQSLSKEEVASLISEAVTAATTPLLQEIGALQEAAGKAPKAEDLVKQAKDQIAADAANAAAAAAATAEASAQRAALRAKVLAAKLPNVPEKLLASLPDTDDEAALTAAAEELRVALEAMPRTKLPDVGGVGKDGGATASESTAPTTPAPMLSPGLAAFAKG